MIKTLPAVSVSGPSALLGRGATTLVAVVCLMFCGLGCASDPSAAHLTLKSVQHGQTFSKQFSGAYVTRDNDGDTDVVLVDQAAEQALNGVRGDAPVRQVMHIRVMWNPLRDQKADHTSASNATIHWYVIGNTPQSAAGIIEYAGTAFVLVERTGGATELEIRNASVQPVAARGELQDPVGSTVLQGSIRATESRQRVSQILSSVRTAVAEANRLPNNVAYGDKPESSSSQTR